MSQIIIDDKENILNTYKRFNVVLTKGNGSIIFPVKIIFSYSNFFFYWI